MRRSLGIVLFICLMMVWGPASLAAEPDARSFAMGGAYVAVVQDATAIYWNPAGLADVKALSVQAGFGVGTQGLDDLTKMITAYQALANRTIPDTPTNFTADVQAGAGFNAAALGLAGFGYNSDLSGRVILDVTTTQASLEVESQLRKDLALGGAKKLAKMPLGLADLRVGGAVKQVQTTVTRYIDDGINPPQETQPVGPPSTKYAVDLGVKAGVAKTVMVGLVAKDLGLDKTRVTLGAAVTPPLMGTTVAVDVENDGTMHFGVEQSLMILDLRAGAVKNPGENLEYRLGLGLNIFGLRGNLGVGKLGTEGMSVMGDLSFTF